MKRIIALFLAASTALTAFAQRTTVSINDCWNFSLGGGSSVVSFPHTWNAVDCDDDEPGYYRGVGVYRKSVRVDDLFPDQRVTVHFEGANQEVTLNVNGKKAGSHVGGYTAFAFDVSELVHVGDNEFEIVVDNSHNPDIAPLSADFTFFGGVYRDVYLIYTPEVSLSTTFFASEGVFVRTGEVSGDAAGLNVTAMLSNAGARKKKVNLSFEIFDPSGARVAESSGKVTLQAGAENVAVSRTVTVKNPELWSLENPEIYRVTARVRDGESVDEVSVPLGIRSFRFDNEEGFFLNGEHVKLMGTNRHQDYLGKGNAIPDEMHERDVRLLKEMGGNFLRVAHYPQDPVVMHECDRAGIVTSVEIPIVNAVTISDAFRENCVEMAREMMYQNFNHPSVVMWAYMNEVCLRIPEEYRKGEPRKEYFAFMSRTAREIEDVFRSGDPGRYTMLPCHSAPELYIEAGIGHIPMIVGFNIYDGWYREDFSHFAKRLDHIHRLYPDQALLVTEYGADVDPRVHSFLPERFDFSCEYGNLYHEAYIPVILDKKFVAGTTVWNLNDFYSEARGQAVPHVNNKGITGLDRSLKDTYYLYQAYLLDSPVMHICSSGWERRGGDRTQKFKVYTNAPEIDVTLNGVSLGRVSVSGHVAEFTAGLRDGWNEILVSGEAGGETAHDRYRFEYRDYSVIDGNFTSLNVILGGRRFFEDNKAQCLWVPEQEYRRGSWGYVGGKPYVTKSSRGVVPASTDNILGTDNNPVFQTARSGIKEFRADVPDGSYSVYLYFCELSTVDPAEAPVYNFGAGGQRLYAGSVFDVSVGGRTVIKDCDIMSEFGEFRSVVRKVRVVVEGGEGLCIGFDAGIGEPYLNAVRIYREF